MRAPSREENVAGGRVFGRFDPRCCYGNRAETGNSLVALTPDVKHPSRPVQKLGDGNDSFHQFTHRLGLGEQPLFDRLGAPLKNPCSRYLSAIDFSGFVVGRNAAKKWKDEVPASGHDKELFFRKMGSDQRFRAFSDQVGLPA
jgi:hypothetical protein